ESFEYRTGLPIGASRRSGGSTYGKLCGFNPGAGSVCVTHHGGVGTATPWAATVRAAQADPAPCQTSRCREPLMITVCPHRIRRSLIWIPIEQTDGYPVRLVSPLVRYRPLC